MPLAEKIRESIQRGEFIEQYCTTLQQITAANFEAGVNVLHTLQQELPVLQNQLQIRALLLYVHRFAIIFGVDKIKIWYQLIFNSIETKDHQLFKALETTVCEIFVKDVRLRDNFIDDYCQCKKITPNRQKILLTFAETKPKVLTLRSFVHSFLHSLTHSFIHFQIHSLPYSFSLHYVLSNLISLVIGIFSSCE
jgi:hypothetical protein